MKPVAIDEFKNFKGVSGMKFSPSGENLCFVVSNTNLEENKYESYIYKMDGNKPVQLTAGGKEGAYVFLDDNTILFAGNRDAGNEPSLESKYYKISLNGGEAKKEITFPIPTGNINPLKNGNFVLTGTVFPGFEKLYEGDKKLAEKCLAAQKAEEDFEVVEENPWWFNGGTFTRGTYEALYYYDSKKKKLSQLSEEKENVIDVNLSLDEKYVFCWIQKKQAINEYWNIKLMRYDLETGKNKVVFESTEDKIGYAFVPGENFSILTISDASKMGGNSNPDFYKVDNETLKIEKIVEFGQSFGGSSVGSDVRRGGGTTMKMVGSVLYFVSTLEDGAYLMKMEDGIIEKVIDKAGSVDCFAVSGNKIVVSALWDMKGMELYDLKCKQLTHFNDKVLRGKYVAIPEKCNVMSHGQEIHGFVLKPIDFDANKKYPVVLDVHGGPKTVYGEVYYHEMQYWAGQGYFVIFCNPVGSDGRGDDFADITGRYGTEDFDNIMDFVDEALKKYPQMDASHLYETGGSYGGFMTNWIVGHTDRFKACVTQRCITNWFSFFGVSDIGLFFTKDQNKATPWNNPELLWEKSPMKHLDKCKTPTLILHSMEDYRCPVDQGYQMYSSLLANGVDTKMVLFKGENHDLSRSGKPKSRVRRLKEITAWFEKNK